MFLAGMTAMAWILALVDGHGWALLWWSLLGLLFFACFLFSAAVLVSGLRAARDITLSDTEMRFAANSFKRRRTIIRLARIAHLQVFESRERKYLFINLGAPGAGRFTISSGYFSSVREFEKFCGELHARAEANRSGPVPFEVFRTAPQ